MTFEQQHEGEPNWGCPRLSDHGAGWLVDWFNARGTLTGASVAAGRELAWIKANPAAVAQMQADVKAWLKG
jgi:hypothetical protein